MTTATETSVATQSHQVYIKAAPEAIWTAITDPDWTDRYGYGGRVEYDLRRGGAFRVHAPESMLARGAPDLIIEGEVIEVDAPRTLVQTWHALFDAETAAEATTRLTWAIEEENGVTKLTVTHELEGAPNVAAVVSGSVPGTGGGWPYVLSDIKTLLETGKPLAG